MGNIANRRCGHAQISHRAGSESAELISGHGLERIGLEIGLVDGFDLCFLCDKDEGSGRFTTFGELARAWCLAQGAR